MKKLTDDEKLARWGKRLQKAADKALGEGRIFLVEYRDISWRSLQAAKPRCTVKVVGL